MSDDFFKIVKNVQETGTASDDGKTPRVVLESLDAHQNVRTPERTIVFGKTPAVPTDKVPPKKK